MTGRLSCAATRRAPAPPIINKRSVAAFRIPASSGRIRHLAAPRTLWIAVLLAALTVAVYLPVRGFNYVEVDDPAYVFENSHVREGLTVDGVTWAFTTGTAANWHPLTWMSHMIDVQLFGLHPSAHHVVNLAF